MNNPKTLISAETLVNAPMEKVWESWTRPQHMAKWNNASEDWHTPQAENDLRVGGRLFLRMETKDGSTGFDHEAIYDDIVTNSKISYTTTDGRTSTILFEQTGPAIKITEIFEPVSEHPAELQRSFCQAILDNFKTYTEGLTS
jgi:uncharacterized protein YndB with AHSA1/START domain